MIASRILAAAFLIASTSLWGQISSTAVGHEFRQDDWPSIAAAPDDSLWIAWLSFVGDRDDVVIRHYSGGKWGNLQWVPGTSGDSFMPQVAVDASNRVWTVWSQQAGSNWDIYARRFDPEKQEWGSLERLTKDPLPDINPRISSNGKGQFAVVWQGFRGKNSNIFLKTFDGSKWSADVRVTNRAVNDWEPAVAIDSKGAAWVAYDSYKNGNYDVFVTPVTDAPRPGAAEDGGRRHAALRSPADHHRRYVGSRLGRLGSGRAELGQGQWLRDSIPPARCAARLGAQTARQVSGRRAVARAGGFAAIRILR